MQGRRRFLRQLACVLAGAGGVSLPGAPSAKPREAGGSGADVDVTLFLCGDVMLGRGLDQILPHPSDPALHEEFVDDARRYLDLAEAESGPIPRPVAYDYVWGDALRELQRRRPDARIVNLETAVTRSDAAWPGKGIHYRMDPRNAGVLAAAGIDACCLANNHVLDWGYEGFADTLAALHGAGIRVAGAGASLAAARAPAVLSLAHGRRVLLFAAATNDAGVPERWSAGNDRAGVHRLPDLSSATVERIADDVARHR
ncbi:MAG TPA: CapA family protein, partial [Lysobacter sp.]